MKPSKITSKAIKLQNQVYELLKPLNKKLAEVLDNESAHFVFQMGDGLCICYDDHHGLAQNACVSFIDIDELFTSNSQYANFLLEKAGI